MQPLTAQQQLEFACKLAKLNGYERIAFVCPPQLFFELQHSLEDCTLNIAWRRATFENGAVIHFVNPEDIKNHPTYFGGYLVTQIFYVSGLMLSPNEEAVLSNRQRNKPGVSAPLKTYYSWGYATWKEYEEYGS